MSSDFLLLKNIRQIVRIVDDDSTSLLGSRMKDVKVSAKIRTDFPFFFDRFWNAMHAHWRSSPRTAELNVSQLMMR